VHVEFPGELLEDTQAAHAGAVGVEAGREHRRTADTREHSEDAAPDAALGGDADGVGPLMVNARPQSPTRTLWSSTVTAAIPKKFGSTPASSGR
jgi:hypothetical protein